MAEESPPKLQNMQIETIGFTNLNNANIISEVVEVQPLRKNTNDSDVPEDDDDTAVTIERADEDTFRAVITVTKNEVTLTKPGAKLQKITVKEIVDNANDIETEVNSSKNYDKIGTVEYTNLERNIISEVPDIPFIIRSNNKLNNTDYNGDNINEEVEVSDKGEIEAVDTETRERDGRLEESENSENEKPEIEVKELEEEVVYKPVSKLPKRIPVKSEIKKEIKKDTKGDAIATAKEYVPPNVYIGRPNIFSETPSKNPTLRHEPPPKPVSKIPKLNKHEVKIERKIPKLTKKDTPTTKDPVHQTDNAMKYKSIGKEKPVKEDNKQELRKTLKASTLKFETIRNNGRPEVNSDAPKSPHEVRGNLEFNQKDDKVVVHRRPKEHKSNELDAVVPVERNSVIIDQIINSQVPDEIDNIFDELYDSLATGETLEDAEVSETPSNETECILNANETSKAHIQEDEPIQNSTHQHTILEINTAKPLINTSSQEENELCRNIKPELIKEDLKPSPEYGGNLVTDAINKDRNKDVTKGNEEITIIEHIDDNSNTPEKSINAVKHDDVFKVIQIDNNGDDEDILSENFENKETSSVKNICIENILILENENRKPLLEDSLQNKHEQKEITVLATPDKPPQRVQAIDLHKDFKKHENIVGLVHSDSVIEPKRIDIKEPNDQNQFVGTNGTINKINVVNIKEVNENPTTDTKSEYVKETFLKDFITEPTDAPSERYEPLGNNDINKIACDIRNIPKNVPAEDKTDKINKLDSPNYQSIDNKVKTTDKYTDIVTMQKPLDCPTKADIMELIDQNRTDHPVQVEQTTDYFESDNTAKPVNENVINEDIIVKNAQDDVEENVRNEEKQVFDEFNTGENRSTTDFENEGPEYASVYTPILTVTKNETTYANSNTKLQKITVTEKIEDSGRDLTMSPERDNIELPVDETAKEPISPIIDLSRPNYRETSRLKMREISERSSFESNRIETKGELKDKESNKNVVHNAKKDVYKPKIVDHVTKKDFKEREITQDRDKNTVLTEEKEKKGMKGKVKDMIYKIANKKPEDVVKKQTKEKDNEIKENYKSEDKPAGKVKNVLQRFESKEELSEPIKKFIDEEPKPVNKKFRHILDRFENKSTDHFEEPPKKNRTEPKKFKNEEDLAREASRGKVQNILKEIESKRDLAISKGKSMENISNNQDFRRQFSRRKSVSETVAMFEVAKI